MIIITIELKLMMIIMIAIIEIIKLELIVDNILNKCEEIKEMI